MHPVNRFPIHMRMKVWSPIGTSILKDSRKALEGEDIKQGTLTSADQRGRRS